MQHPAHCCTGLAKVSALFAKQRRVRSQRTPRNCGACRMTQPVPRAAPPDPRGGNGAAAMQCVAIVVRNAAPVRVRSRSRTAAPSATSLPASS
jgi:hypothetical protein